MLVVVGPNGKERCDAELQHSRDYNMQLHLKHGLDVRLIRYPSNGDLYNGVVLAFISTCNNIRSLLCRPDYANVIFYPRNIGCTYQQLIPFMCNLSLANQVRLFEYYGRVRVSMGMRNDFELLDPTLIHHNQVERLTQ